ncbi:MAG: UDP-glucose 4-epimerase GalE [Ferrovum myxofaciens]|uniref:UDP-glucose 4-epimerase GalE n=1 Tax=Ferrovum myxofaciens TaxID=416213 RepID=UPI002355B682|nr:UDP-glucose 4-epimerase GalE [Ferrovum myxofaciens]QKE40830.1 MAG: UDP-glucose 4-epimerase GalE [Ferrovum myxofaciens]
MNNKKNVLVAGGAGYIGSHVVTVLLKAGFSVVVLDNFSNSDPSVLQRLEKITGQTVPFVHADLRTCDTVVSTLRNYRINSVIHLAGLKAVGESVAKPIEYYGCNIQGTLSLLEAMQTCGVHELVFSSSATVYGDPQTLPLDETHPTSATNPYGRSKLHIEEMLHDVARASEKWKIVCLRYFNPVGAHPSALIGEDPAGIPNNLMPFVAQVASGKRPLLRIFGNDYPTPDGTGVRDYIHVMDLAEGHRSALDFVATQPGWQAINLGSGRGHSVLEMVAAFEKASGRSIPYQIVDRRPGDIASCIADPARALRVLHWKTTRSLEDMCTSTWAWQRYREVGV